MKMRIAKCHKYERYYRAIVCTAANFSTMGEARAWQNSSPVEREFCSSNYERLAAINALRNIVKVRGISDEELKQWREEGRK